MKGKGHQGGLQMQAADVLLFLCTVGFEAQAHLPGRHIKKAICLQNAPGGCLLLQLPEILPAVYLPAAGC